MIHLIACPWKGDVMLRIARIDWPDFGAPALPPVLTLPELEGRLSQLRGAMAERNLDVLAVYADREHSANMQWLTGFEPRFEEAFLVLTADRGTLLVGNECLTYTQVSPLVQAGRIGVELVPSLSLISQPRKGRRIADVLGDLVPVGARVGTAGWKYFGADEFDAPDDALDLPAFLADPLRQVARQVVNATDLFMHPGHGLRSTVSVADIARLEFSNHMAAKALTRMAFGLREGMSDFVAFAQAGIGGLPLGCHLTFATGAMADQGMSGPTGQIITRGKPLSFNVCHWGSNICRAGWVAAGPDDLPLAARGHVAEFAGPYVAAMSLWCSLMRPGMAGGDVWAQMMAALPFGMFGITLNPGHLIGMDEWISSPISEGSDLPLRSGMAFQMDVIPGHADFASTRMEDGYVIADAALRTELTVAYPEVAARCAARAAFMRDVIGMDVPDTLLPLADTCGIVAPYLLDPGQVIVLR
jgi:Xaa-Pro aminopeptidase